MVSEAAPILKIRSDDYLPLRIIGRRDRRSQGNGRYGIAEVHGDLNQFVDIVAPPISWLGQIRKDDLPTVMPEAHH